MTHQKKKKKKKPNFHTIIKYPYPPQLNSLIIPITFSLKEYFCLPHLGDSDAYYPIYRRYMSLNFKSCIVNRYKSQDLNLS